MGVIDGQAASCRVRQRVVDHVAEGNTLQVVGHHDLAGLEGGDELLFHIGLETGALLGTVQHPRRDQAVVAEAGDEG